MTRLRLAGLILLAACAGPAAAPAEDPASAADPAHADAPATAVASDQAGPAYVTRAPAVTAADAAGIGEPVAFDFVDLDGTPGSLAGLAAGARGVVVVFTSLECPVTRLYAPLLADYARAWEARGLRVLAVAAAPQDAAADLRARAAGLGWAFPVARDPGFAITAALGAERTADCFLLDGAARLRYRGALDDQYGINYRRPAPRQRYLEDAVTALLQGEAPAVAATCAPGCRLR